MRYSRTYPLVAGLPSLLLAVPAVLVPASPTWAITAAGPDAPPNSIRGINGPILLAQDEGGDNSEVTPAEIEKYVAVYRAMHRDRSLTVEQAAAQQGMTVAAFRSLENRVQRDDAALQHARDELQASAVHASTPASPIPGGTKR